MYLSVSASSQVVVLVVLPIHILIHSTLPHFSLLCGTVEVVTLLIRRCEVVVVAGHVDMSQACC